MRFGDTVCSSAAQQRVGPSLISDNTKLIRMRAEIKTKQMLPNQKGKQPEGALEHLWLRLVTNTEDIIYCTVVGIHLLSLLGLVCRLNRLLCVLSSLPVLPRRAEISKIMLAQSSCMCNMLLWTPAPIPLKQIIKLSAGRTCFFTLCTHYNAYLPHTNTHTHAHRVASDITEGLRAGWQPTGIPPVNIATFLRPISTH